MNSSNIREAASLCALPQSDASQGSERVPKVSIGLPVFNGENYLREALDCLFAQTYTDVEFVICDNASTDATQAICREYAARDERVMYHRNGENLGAAKNFNRTFELARGEYFRWMGHDDRLHPDYLECCVRELEAAPESVAMVFTGTRYIDKFGQVVPEERGRRIRGARKGDPFQDISFARLLRMPPSAAPIFVFGLMRSSMLRKTRLIGSYIASDVVINAEIRLLGSFREIPRELFDRRIHLREAQRAKRKTLRGEAEWFDPNATHHFLLPGFRLCVELLRGIHRLPLGFWKSLYATGTVGVFAAARCGRFLHQFFFSLWSDISQAGVRNHMDNAVFLRLWCLFSGLRSEGPKAFRVALASRESGRTPLPLVVFGALRVGRRGESKAENLIIDWLHSEDQGEQIGAALATQMNFVHYRDICATLWAESGQETDLEGCLERIIRSNKEELMAFREQLPEEGPTTVLLDRLTAVAHEQVSHR